MDKVGPALIGKAGEYLVAGELLRRGVEVAVPASDVGVDLLAYRLTQRAKTASLFVPIQVKAYSGTGYRFQKSWFERAPGLALVLVWHIGTTPEFYVFGGLDDAVAAVGEKHAATSSWSERGVWSATTPTAGELDRMRPHRNQWDRILGQLGLTNTAAISN